MNRHIISLLNRGYWYNALTIGERIKYIKKESVNISYLENSKLGYNRLYDWKKQTPFNEKSIFHKRLKLDDLNEKEFLYILSETKRGKYRNSPPHWVVKFANILENEKDFKMKSMDNTEKDYNNFLLPCAPFINYVYKNLFNCIKFFNLKYKYKLIETDNIQSIFLEEFYKKLYWIIYRTIILEINIARLKNDLKGNTPRERYNDYFNKLRSIKNKTSLFMHYPILSRKLFIITENFNNFYTYFIGNLYRDYIHIKKFFNNNNGLGRLIKITEMGDLHRMGNAVILAYFSTNFNLIYKPRSLKIDNHFQQFLKYLNKKIKNKFYIYKIIDNGNYGWCEYIPYKPCKTKSEIKKYYLRQGYNVAILYALEGTDIHYENVIANGEYPIIIDLETLFHPDIINKKLLSKFNSAEIKCFYQIKNSVLKVGLLPQRTRISDNYEGVDYGGLSNYPGQIIPFPIPQIINRLSDKIRIEFKETLTTKGNNIPMYKNKQILIDDYKDQIINGFKIMYNIFIKNKNRLLSKNGPINMFKNDSIRLLFRASQVYALLLFDSYHPRYLINSIDRAKLLDKLWRSYPQQLYLGKIIKSENIDLENNDIPIFYSSTNSRKFYDSQKKQLGIIFAKSGLFYVKKRLKSLNPNDMNKQLWFIHLSLSCLDKIHAK